MEMDDLRYQGNIKEEAKENVGRKHDNYVMQQSEWEKPASSGGCLLEECDLLLFYQ